MNLSLGLQMHSLKFFYLKICTVENSIRKKKILTAELSIKQLNDYIALATLAYII